MESSLAKNIRFFRKQQNLTQQQLADAMGVTVGAIHKWETGLSTPDIRVIMDLARFFGTSLDALAGYEMEPKEKARILQALQEIRLQKTCRARREQMEFWLRLYPNDFEIAFLCGQIYQLTGTETLDQDLLGRAIFLLRHAAELSPSQATTMEIHQKIGFCLLDLGLREQGIRELQAYNPFGIHSDTIGMELAEDPGCRDQALSSLSKAMLNTILSLQHIGSGYLQIFFREGRYQEARSLLETLIRFLNGLEIEKKTSFLTKDLAVFSAMKAAAEEFLGNQSEAERNLMAALEAAKAFDADPDYTTRNVLYCQGMAPASTFDGSGPTAMEAVHASLEEVNSPCLKTWEDLCHET